MNDTKKTSSVRFTNDELRLMALIRAKLGIKQGALIALAIRALAEKEKVR